MEKIYSKIHTQIKIKELIKSKNKIYIYGAGITAKKVFHYLTKLGINIDGFIVDNVKDDSLYDKPVIALSKCSKDPITLILGYVPTTENVSQIHNRILLNLNLIDFIASDFTFLSFGVFPENYLKSDEYYFVNNILCDNISKDLLVTYVNSRNSGNYSECELFYNPNQYFPDDLIKVQPDETFVDCGVYDGETSKEFARRSSNNFNFIFGFEPDKSNFDNSINNLNDLPFEKIKIFNLGTWYKSDILKFNSNSSLISGIDPKGEVEVKVDSLDNVLGDLKVTYIKMDVEGAELLSLKGAINTIIKNKPKLAICLYHKPEDIYDVISWINSLDLNYSYYIRLHTRFSQELVLYCV